MRFLRLTPKEVKRLIYVLEIVEEDTGLFDEQIKMLKKLKKSLKPIKVSSRKGKGRDLQKWVCERISEITGVPYDQADDNCEIHSREMGQSGTDVILRGGVAERIPFSIECKSQESLDLRAAVEQAKKNIIEGTDWLIVHKRQTIKNPIVITDWAAFHRVLVWATKDAKNCLKGLGV